MQESALPSRCWVRHRGRMRLKVLVDSIVRKPTFLSRLPNVESDMRSLAHGLARAAVASIRELRAVVSAKNSLSNGLLEFVRETGTILQTDVVSRFACEDAATVRATLDDLVEDGVLFRTGRGPWVKYCAATKAEMELSCSSPRMGGTLTRGR